MAEQAIYHEKQSLMLCAVHALNNIFQDPKAFSKSDFDEICYNLSPGSYINPHKNMIGLGNYDVNVLMTAIGLKGFDTVWFDKRMSLDTLCFDKIFGFVINKPSKTALAGLTLPVKKPHWFSIRKIDSTYYNLDSKLSNPNPIGNKDSDLRQFLENLILEESKVEILLVVEKSASDTKAWKKADDE